MCGIGVLIGDDIAAVALPMLARTADAQRHRGPDGEGWLLVDGALRPTVAYRRPAAVDTTAGLKLAAAFNRLVVQDATPAARQPLGSPDEQAWILHNGEIYNHAELRRPLEARGHEFRTASDAETALAAYRAWGDDCFARFRGMWAMVIVDLERGRLVGCRDRLGIKPLFWTARPGLIAFASEPAALRPTLDRAAAPDDVRLRAFLEGRPAADPDRSFLRDVRPVPAATRFAIDLRRPERPSFQRFWRLSAFSAASADAPSFAGASSALGDLVADAVREQLAARVPVGTLLSGGIDSSLVTTLAARARRASCEAAPPAFSIVYADPSMSEWPFVMAAARGAGVRAHTCTLTPAGAWASVDAVVRAQGEPLLGQDLIAQYHAYGTARAHGAVVVLDGQGADELLAGLPLYARARSRELLRGLRLAPLAAELSGEATRLGESPVRTLNRHFVAPAAHAMRDRLRLRRYAWLPPAPSNGNGDDAAPEASADASLLNRTLFGLVTRTNLPAVLLHQDRSAMAHGVEARVPFLDHRIVELCFRLPPEHKVLRGVRKRVLLECARGVLPPVILARRDKRRFVTRGDWLPRPSYADPLRAMAASPTLAAGAGIRHAEVVRFVDDFLRARHDDRDAVWRLYTLWRWLETG